MTRRWKYILFTYILLDLLIGYAGFFPGSEMLAAQTTTVSGIVTDPNGLPYANGTITAHLVTTGTTPTIGGNAFDASDKTFGLNSVGAFAVSLFSSTAMTPNLQYLFTVCSGAGTVGPAIGTGSQCFNAGPITVTGTTQSITAQLVAAATALSNVAGVKLSPAGAANDIVSVQGASSIGAADSGNFTYLAGLLNVPAASISGNLSAFGTEYFHNPFNGDGTPNSATGTTNGLLAKTVNVGGLVQAQVCATTDTSQACFPVTAQRVGTVFNGCTSACTTGNAYIQSTPGGQAACLFDNTSVVNDYVVASTSTAGQCHDTGSATAPTSGWIVGRAKTAGTASQTVSIEPQIAGGAGTFKGYVLSLQNASYTPVASVTRYFGLTSIAPDTTVANVSRFVPIAGTIVSYTGHCKMTAGSGGAGEQVGLSVYLNGAVVTGSTSSQFWSATNVLYNVTGISQATSVNDSITIQVAPPATWVTPAATVTCSIDVVIQ